MSDKQTSWIGEAMASRHTPGPWTAHKMAGGMICVAPPNRIAVADCCDMGDALLIAAAPDLLAALQAVVIELDAVHRSDRFSSADDALAAANAAIAKAFGHTD